MKNNKDILKKILLNMKYDPKKSLVENKMLIIKESNTLCKSIEDFKDLRKVLGPQEYQNLVQSPPEIQQRVLQNYNSLFNAFAERSLWFGKLLASIFEHRLEIMKQLGQKLEDLPQRPNFLRVSLSHYSFADQEINADQKDIWQVTPIMEASFVISNQ